MAKLGIIGCGDVAFRSYFPVLEQLGDAQVVACFDTVADRAERAASRFPGAEAYTSYEEFLAHPELEAVVNLTPAPLHAQVTEAALRAGKHVLSEKPIASKVDDAQALIELAKEQGLLLLAAPAVMATPRFKWVKRLLASGRIGSPTLAVAQMATMGPASWREYTGDPTVFYSAAVGPVVDIGVYALHAVTGLLGPARRVQAMGGIAIPERTVLAGPHAGKKIQVEANDHVLIHLDFGHSRFAQVLASFAVPNSKAPAIELHCTGGTLSLDITRWYEGYGSIDVYLEDGSELGVEGWINGLYPPLPDEGPTFSLIGYGPAHFVRCLAGKEEPILTAEHATHVLEIMNKIGDSIRQGRALDLDTSF